MSVRFWEHNFILYVMNTTEHSLIKYIMNLQQEICFSVFKGHLLSVLITISQGQGLINHSVNTLWAPVMSQVLY